MQSNISNKHRNRTNPGKVDRKRYERRWMKPAKASATTTNRIIICRRLSHCCKQRHRAWGGETIIHVYSRLGRRYRYAAARCQHATKHTAISEEAHLTALSDYIQDAQLSQRDRAAGCVIVFAESRTLELGDNDLRTV